MTWGPKLMCGASECASHTPVPKSGTAKKNNEILHRQQKPTAGVFTPVCWYFVLGGFCHRVFCRAGFCLYPVAGKTTR